MSAEKTALSPQDRIAVLEDLLAFHRERNLKGVGEILEVVAYLGGINRPDLAEEILRARVAYACTGLTRLAHEMAIGSLDGDETQAALKRSQFIASHPELLS